MTGDKTSLHIRRIAISAIFISIALVLKMAFSFHIPLFGQNGMRIGISGIFSIMPSILFGPIYGAIVSGLSDFMGYILKPTGPYIPLMTLLIAAGAFLRGVLWMALRNRSIKKMRILVVVISAILLIFGLCNIYFLNADGVNNQFYSNVAIEDINTDDMHLVSKMLIARTSNTKDPAGNLATYIVSMTAGVLGSAAFGLLLLIVDLIISKKFLRDSGKSRIMPLLIAMVVSGVVVTTLNTILLRETIYASWKVLPFAVVWIPRVIEELLGNAVKAYFVAMLLGVFEKQRNLKTLIE